MELIIVGVIALLLIFVLIGIYNRLVGLRQNVNQGTADIDAQLRQRHDLIPNLVSTVKGYATHEQDTLQQVIAARNAAATGSPNSGAEAGLRIALDKMLALGEAYPDLKANTTFLEFQAALQTVEDEIQMSRRYYNGAVRNLNIQVESFPSNLIANAFKFIKAQYFELENEADRQVPSVKF